jgi:hypothetical protein
MNGSTQRFAQAFLEPCRDLEEEPLRALVAVRAFEVLRLPGALRGRFVAADFLVALPRALELLRALVGVRAFEVLRRFVAADFLVAFRPAPEAAERLVLLRLGADATFFLEPRLRFLGEGFTRASMKAVAALDITSAKASTFALAAVAIASCADVLSPSFSLSIVLPFVTLVRGSHLVPGGARRSPARGLPGFTQFP